jgi:gentisate 1,2-dioxygenase
MGEMAQELRTDPFGSSTSLEELNQALIGRNLTPGWIPRKTPVLWNEMRSRFVPAHWRYAETKAGLLAASRLTGTDVIGERRNLLMRNPFPDNNFETLRTLLLAYQTMLPRERAKSHRHSPHALRVILEAEGAWSVVNGEQTPMETGDIVLTPGWHWHGHGAGDTQAFWIDCLDVPLTHLLEPMYYEHHPEGYETPVTSTATSSLRFAWSSMRAALRTASGDPEEFFGTALDLPTPSMPTITLQVHEWNKGWRNRPYRRSANTAFVVLQGHGVSVVGADTFEWEFGDTFLAPAWTRVEHRVSAEAVVVAISDEALMRWTRYYRVEAVE